MKATPFTKFHEQLGAKMAEFAGYNMPIVYSGINEEHLIVRTGVGVFDVSHMGEFWIKGPKAFDLVQKITTNNVAKLIPEAAQYSCFPNGKGGIVDDLIVYYYEPQKYLLVVNAANTEKDWNWVVQQNKTVGAEIENASDNIAQLAIQGPKAVEAMQKLTDVDLSAIKFYHFTVGSFAGIKNVIISATGYTGAGGLEIYMYNSDAEHIWKAVFEAGKEYGIAPIGLGARDTLRLEMGYCLYGNDIDDTTSPLEAGLGWITKFEDGNHFIDREFMENLKAKGLQKSLVGFEMIDKGVPRHGYDVVDEKGKVIGHVTSGTMSPMLKKGIGMAYVPFELKKPGTEILIQIRNKNLKAEVVKLPFWKG